MIICHEKENRFFSIIALAGIIAAAGIYQSQNNRLSYLTLANIEALADEEQTVDIPCVPDENETSHIPSGWQTERNGTEPTAECGISEFWNESGLKKPIRSVAL